MVSMFILYKFGINGFDLNSGGHNESRRSLGSSGLCKMEPKNKKASPTSG